MTDPNFKKRHTVQGNSVALFCITDDIKFYPPGGLPSV